jgi:hypothetical protein
MLALSPGGPPTREAGREEDSTDGGSRGTSIRIFLVDGTAEGLRLVETSNWTGQPW